MPAKPAQEQAKTQPKKPVRKNQNLELDPTPTSVGEGYFVHPSQGAIYEGQWQRFDGQIKKHGNGIYTDCGATYDGQFSEDLYHGNGNYTAIDGSSYHGEWVKGKMHGKGVYSWPDGSYFDGNFEDGKMEGPGILVDPKKRIWIGTWKDGIAELDIVPNN